MNLCIKIYLSFRYYNIFSLSAAARVDNPDTHTQIHGRKLCNRLSAPSFRTRPIGLGEAMSNIYGSVYGNENIVSHT